MKMPLWKPENTFAGVICYCILLLAMTISSPIIAQDIILRNPSLEGESAEGKVPDPWIAVHETPDIQPGIYKVSLPASEGNTYVGMICYSYLQEGMAQKLSTSLQAGKTYMLSFDLAYPPNYSKKICYGSFVIYGGNNVTDKAEVLWQSDPFYNINWERHTVFFTPSHDYTYISFSPYFSEVCSSTNFSAVLVDNFSSIREAIKIELLSQNTCRGISGGTAMVKIMEGHGPYSYLWTPGNDTTSRVSGLSPGNYEVTVKDANGAITKGNVVISEYQIKATAAIRNIDCYGNKDAGIVLSASGGGTPYLFSIDSGYSYQESPYFNSLSPGSYDVVVRDAYSCIADLGDVLITQPDPLVLESVKVRPVSCNETTDGSITLTPGGGTPPYTYSIPGYISQSDSSLRQLDAGRYYYRLTDSHECKVDGEADINKEWRDCLVIIPNAFTPNGDGVNDVFRAQIHDAISDYHIAIYGRWGQLIFESRDPESGWNGQQNGISLPMGSYLWLITYTDSKHQARKQKGNLVLIK
jgi:gliding motility-associated-like protein